MKKVLLLITFILLVGCSENPSETQYAKEKEITEQSIKSISSSISSVGVYKQYTGNVYNIDVTINGGIIFGGAQDWNGAATKVFNISKMMFFKPEVQKITFIIQNDDRTIDWAHIEIDRKSLPEKWNELTYLEFFSFTKPTSGSPEADQWLNEFYSKYSSALPQ